jgi:acetoin utilization deacetylase AcuC-like enzyme
MAESPTRRSPWNRFLRHLRRWLRIFRRALRRPKALVVYDRRYGRTVSGVPLDSTRAERILAFLVEERLLSRGDVLHPRRASLSTLLRVHTEEYMESLQRRATLTQILGVEVTDQDVEMVLSLQRLMVGGTIQAVRAAQRTCSVGVNLGGGFHHATRSTGMGFCIFNDVAVAIAWVRSTGFDEPILVIDLDLHDGNGTREIFAEDPTVHTYSVHGEDWGETEVVASTSIALGDSVGDELYLETLRATLPGVIASFDPGLVFYLAGADPAADDRLGNWKITPEAMLERDQLVVEQLRHRRRPVPLAIVLGGGYGDEAWRYTARFLAWVSSGHPVEPPENEELTLMRLRRVREELDPAALTSEPGGFSWRLTDEDLAGILPGVEPKPRFLGYFSTHGVELALERFGIMDQLRARGFGHPTVKLELKGSTGQTLRIYADRERTELLVELRVNRSSRAVQGMEVLVIEWLLLQNPRADFSPERRRLPGQKHPGLGILKELFGWLVVIGEMLELDGVFYAPSGFHVAAQSRRLVRFLDPVDEARFRALRELLGDLPLDRASNRVAEGDVVDAVCGGRLEWEGCPMVLPISERLKMRVFSEEYEARVRDELQKIRLRLGGDLEASGG